MSDDRCQVSVVIAARNAAATLPLQIESVIAQGLDCPFELVIVDNGSHDGTADIVLHYAEHDPRVRLVTERRVGKNVALNTGIAEALGAVIALCDADDVAEPGWLSSLVGSLEGRVFVGGRRRIGAPNTVEERELFGVDGVMPTSRISTKLGHPSPSGATCAFWKEMWCEVGGFDERIAIGLDEEEFFARAGVIGWSMVEAPGAVVQYRVPGTVGEAFRKGYRNGRNTSRAMLMIQRDGLVRHGSRTASPPPVRRSVPPLIHRMHRKLRPLSSRWWRIMVEVPSLVVRRHGRGNWARRVGIELGHLVGNLQGPLSSEPRHTHLARRPDRSS